MYRNTYVEVDLNVIQKNIQNILKKYPDYKYYIGVIKGNAYGHGFHIAKTLIDNGINYLAVATLDEALLLRAQVDAKILVLEPIDLKYIDLCIKNNITITISSYDYFKKLMAMPIKNLSVHLKLNTGMNRLGLDKTSEVTEIYNTLINNKNINLEGIYTHLATNGIIDKIYDKQIQKFLDLTDEIDLKKIPIVHLGRSSTLEYHPKIPFANAIRLGAIMYGIKVPKINYSGLKGFIRKLKHHYLIKQNHISKTFTSDDIDVNYAFKLKSEVVEVKKIKKGDIVGYGGKYQALKDTYVAVLLIGYADGLDLKYTNYYVSINNQKYRIIGSVNMGMITVEVDRMVKVGDIATIIGDNVSSIAKHLEVTPYVVMTSISTQVERRYIEVKKVGD